MSSVSSDGELPPVGAFFPYHWSALCADGQRALLEKKEADAAAAKSHKRKATAPPPTPPTRSSSRLTPSGLALNSDGSLASKMQMLSPGPGRLAELRAMDKARYDYAVQSTILAKPPNHQPSVPRRVRASAPAPRVRKSTKTVSPSSLLTRQPLPFDLPPPSIALHHVKGDEASMRSWVKEAVQVWDAMAEERRAKPGHQPSRWIAGPDDPLSLAPRKQTTYTSKNAARDRRRQMEKEAAAKKAQEQRQQTRQQQQQQQPQQQQQQQQQQLVVQRKPSIVAPIIPQEDTSLPSFASSSPLPSSDALFRLCPPSFLSFVLRTFDVLHLYAEPLSFSLAPHRLTLPLFLSALLTPPSPVENHAVNLIMAALVRTVLRTPPSPDAPSLTEAQLSVQRFLLGSAKNPGDTEDVREGLVCNAVTWQRRMRDWLTDDALLRTVKKRQRNELRTISSFLSIDTFYQLPLHQRLFLLNLLTVEALRSPTLRLFFHTAVETLASMRKSALLARNAQIHSIRESEGTLPEVALCVMDIIDSAVQHKKKDRESGHTVHSLLKLGRAHLREVADRSAAGWERRVQEAVDKYKLRTISIGVDRHFNRYWTLGGQTDILVISHSDDYTKRYQAAAHAPPKPHSKQHGEEVQVKEEKREEDGGAAPMELDEKETETAEMKEGRKEKSRAEPAYTRWSYISGKEQFAALLSWLHPAGIRDKALKDALTKINFTFQLKEQQPPQPQPQQPQALPPSATRMQDARGKEEKVVDAQPPPLSSGRAEAKDLTTAPFAPATSSSSLSTSPSSLSSTVHPLLSYDSLQVNEWNRTSLRAYLILTAEDSAKGQTRYVRCLLCQEAVDQSGEAHCPICHITVHLQPPLDAPTFHSNHSCPGQPRIVLAWKAGGIFVNETREEERERDEVVVDLDVKLKPLIKGRRKVDSESDSDSDEEEEPDDDDNREDERRVRFAVKEEEAAVKLEGAEEKKAEGEGQQAFDGEEEQQPPHAADELIPSSSPSATPPPGKKAALVTVSRVTPRATSLSTVSSNFQLNKAMLLDIEAAIPVEAVKVYTKTAQRMVWVEHVKLTCRLRVMGRGLSELGKNLKLAWIRPWFKIDDWVRRCWEVDCDADLAACLFEFDRALIYSNDEKEAEAQAQTAHTQLMEEEEEAKIAQGRGGQTATAEVEDEDDGEEVCRICKSGEDPDSLLICDHCDREYHMDCLQPPLRSVPKGKWFCPPCRKKGLKTLTGKAAPKVTTSMKGKGAAAGGSKKGGKGADKKRSSPVPDETLAQVSVQELPADYGICKKCHLNEGDPLLCDRCDDAYHLTCLDPPLDAVPEGDWFCVPCKAEIREEEEVKRRLEQQQQHQQKEEEDEEYQQPGGAGEEDEEDEAADQEVEDAEADEGGEDAGDDGADDDELPIASRKAHRRVRLKESETDNEDDELDQTLLTGNGHAGVDEDDEEEEYFAPSGNNGTTAGAINGQASSRRVQASDSDLSAATSEDVCSVCFSPDSRDDNAIMYCDGCDLPIHQQCQGLDEVPEGDFFCDRCAAKIPPDSKDFPCVLCGLHLPAGAMKQVEEGSRAGEWVHISCMVFYPDVGWTDVVARSGVQGVDEVDPALLGHRCDACKGTQGAMLHCDAPHCNAWMHVPCALANKDYTMSWSIENGTPIVYCKRHKVE